MGDPLISDIPAQLNQRIADLAREILGEPNRALSTQTQLRYGTHGSRPKRREWYDRENKVGGGV